MRRLALGLALLGSMIPGLSLALGLGEIKVDSALNQPLKAEISVVSASPDEVIDIVAKLASDDAFKRVGIQREFVLTKLQFKPAVRNGVPVILVTTKQPVKEPFLDFLVEVRWPKGRLVREYTILLDPPVMMEQRTVATQAPVVAETPAEPARMMPEPEPAPAPAPVAVYEPEPAVEPEPEPIGLPAAEPVMISEEEAVYQAAPQESLFPMIPIGAQEETAYYAGADAVVEAEAADFSDGYKVAANDTLWEIANQARPEGVSVNQMMVAMLHANPDAFQKNNINNLKRGVILRMPSQEELDAVDSRAANTEVSEQYALWREYRTQMAGEAIPQEAVPATDESQPEADVEQVAVAEQPAAELKILAPEAVSETGETVLAGGDDVSTLQNDLSLARESLESARQENQDLRSRVEQLEQMMQKQERLMNLKDEQLSDMQQQLDETGTPQMEEPLQMPAAEPSEMEGEPQEVVEAPVEPAMEVMEPAVEAEQPEEIVVEETVIAEEGMTEEPVIAEDEVVSLVELPVEQEAEPPAQPEPVEKPELVQPTPPKSPSLLTDLFSNPKMLGFVGIGVLVVLALIATILRRMGKNREAAEEPVTPIVEEPFFEETPVEPEAEAVLEAVEEVQPEEVTEEAPAEKGQIAGEQTHVMDFASQEISAEAVAEEAAGADDTISEADVYLAYGLHQQCEDLLKNALGQSPERNDYRAKLLENYFAAKEQEKFELLASELHDKLGDTSSPIWSRVIVMGRELAPENALFQEADVGDLSIDDVVTEKPEAAEFDLTAEDLAIGATEVLEEETATTDAGLEFDIGDVDLGDLDLGEAGSEISETSDTSTIDIEPTLDIEELAEEEVSAALDLDIDIEGPAEVERKSETEVMTAPPEPPETMIVEGPPDFEAKAAEEHDTGTLDISDMDLGDLDLGEDIDLDVSDDLGLGGAVDFGAGESEVTETMTDESAAFDVGDEVDLDEEMGLPDSEDEVSTKLDLAKAYIDMGDNDGAKSTLEEVMIEGNDEQKKEAQELLGQLG